MKAAILFSLLLALSVFIGLNYRQLYTMWMLRREHQRLIKGTINSHHENPASMEDRFEDGFSQSFWNFIIINSGGKVSNDTAWHATAITTKRGLTIYHFPDATFENESSNLFDKPAAGQYNNVTLKFSVPESGPTAESQVA